MYRRKGMSKTKLEEVPVMRPADELNVTESHGKTHVTINNDTMKAEIVNQLWGFFGLHGIRTLRRTELHELCAKAHGLLKTDSDWGIHSFEKPLDDLEELGVIERIKYTEPKKATYIRLTNSYMSAWKPELKATK